MKIKKIISCTLLILCLSFSLFGCKKTQIDEPIIDPSAEEEPVAPVEPNDPETPDDPDIPDEPDTPDEPDAPDEPTKIYYPINFIESTNGNDTILSPDAIKGNNWMSYLPDTASLGQINLPGSHDATMQQSKTYKKFWSVTQTLSIYDQMNIGVRYFDIRTQITKNCLYCSHGGDLSYNDGELIGWSKNDVSPNGADISVLEKCNSFLASNPTETIILQFQQEDDSDFDIWYQKMVNGINSMNSLDIPTHFYLLETGDKLPTIAEARGNVYCYFSTNIYKYEDHYVCSTREKKNYLINAWNTCSTQDYENDYYITKANENSIPFICYSSYSVNNIATPNDLNGWICGFHNNSYTFTQGTYYGAILNNFVDERTAKTIYLTNKFENVYIVEE